MKQQHFRPGTFPFALPVIFSNFVFMKILLTTLMCCFFSLIGTAQGSFAWGVKGGITAGFQQWNSYEQDPLFKYHGDLYIESYDSPDANALFAQIGYHVKGSALRNRNGRTLTGDIFRLSTRTFEFNNASFSTGFKQRFDVGAKKAYYLVGLRADYTLSTNLSDYDNLGNGTNRFFYPFDDFVRKFNYGITGGAGMEFMFGDLIGGVIEFSLAPDISFQYEQPAIGNVYDPFTGNDRNIPERRIRNFAAEISVGFRFLRIVEYVD